MPWGRPTASPNRREYRSSPSFGYLSLCSEGRSAGCGVSILQGVSPAGGFRATPCFGVAPACSAVPAQFYQLITNDCASALGIENQFPFPHSPVPVTRMETKEKGLAPPRWEPKAWATVWVGDGGLQAGGGWRGGGGCSVLTAESQQVGLNWGNGKSLSN